MFEDDDSWSYLDQAVDWARLKAAKFVLVVLELFEKGEQIQVRGNGWSGDGELEEDEEDQRHSSLLTSYRIVSYIDQITKRQPINRVRSPTNEMTHLRVIFTTCAPAYGYVSSFVPMYQTPRKAGHMYV